MRNSITEKSREIERLWILETMGSFLCGPKSPSQQHVYYANRALQMRYMGIESLANPNPFITATFSLCIILLISAAGHSCKLSDYTSSAANHDSLMKPFWAQFSPPRTNPSITHDGPHASRTLTFLGGTLTCLTTVLSRRPIGKCPARVLLRSLLFRTHSSAPFWMEILHQKRTLSCFTPLCQTRTIQT